ncbi:hypothetical protein E1263_29530 [Kribbella antibiotica]|uniref:DUF3592 domain-containing protein n=1 Tax=Kribbella antibiotica TaxID=190195 RepID=A0A4R4Z2S8_9ACTN|nr:hypothetical protein [Kribbella antibiotica]TDD52106.1 hypothetical protein E1263_29530 [Kribbella antibiotica]
MSDPDDTDLHGWQLAFLLLFFVGVGGGLYLIGWLARPSFLYDHPFACPAIAGFLCYPARFLAERFGWWNRLEVRRQARRQRPVRRGREIAVRVVRVVVGLPIAVGSLAILPLGILDSRRDVQLVAAGPVQTVKVVEVERDRWSKGAEIVVKVARPGDGVAVELGGGDELDPLPAVGDEVDVVIDPSDPSYVLAAAVDWAMPWWAYLIGAVITLACLAMGWWIAFF